MERVRKMMRGVSVAAAVCAAAVCAAAMVQAQEYAVSSFEIAPRDLTARTAATSRVDANGRKCAVVKVYANDNIREVHGPAVGQVADHGMEKWIYLSHDAKQMELLFDRHYPLTVSFIDFDYPTLSGQMTYILKLSEKTTTNSISQTDIQAVSRIIREAYGVDGVYRTDMKGVRYVIKELYNNHKYEKCLELCQIFPNDYYSQYYTGLLYYDGKGVTQDYDQAVKYFRKAANRVIADNAQNKLGDCYYFGIGVTRDYSEAVRWYRRAANEDNADAQYALGVCYNRGEGVTMNDDEAAKWFSRAADQGNTNAKYALGNCQEGKTIIRDDAEALKWYQHAALRGDAEAQYKLGYCYFWNLGVKAEAVKWYTKAAEQGNKDAQLDLGYMYYDGLGVTKDNSEAAKWYRKAAEQGDEYAREMLKKLGETY